MTCKTHSEPCDCRTEYYRHLERTIVVIMTELTRLREERVKYLENQGYQRATPIEQGRQVQ